jgi:hypothetical protein
MAGELSLGSLDRLEGLLLELWEKAGLAFSREEPAQLALGAPLDHDGDP